MSETRIPGLKAAHRFVTDTCRENKGDEVTIEESLATLRKEASEAMKGWAGTPGVRFHFVLVVEPPS